MSTGQYTPVTPYYRARSISDDDQALMKGINKHHLDNPFLGSRRLTDVLNEQGGHVGRNRVIRLLRLMGISSHLPKTTDNSAQS